jgi:4-hydroxybenzoate polyprenyltransferase
MLYYGATAIAAGLLVIEQSLVKVDDISRINLAFMTVNGVVGVVFSMLAIADLLWR